MLALLIAGAAIGWQIYHSRRLPTVDIEASPTDPLPPPPTVSPEEPDEDELRAA